MFINIAEMQNSAEVIFNSRIMTHALLNISDTLKMATRWHWLLVQQLKLNNPSLSEKTKQATGF